MPRRLLKHIFAILVLLVVAGCSGGGCGGCAGCGVTPLPNGFPVEARVENAGSARLTQSGLTFLQSNLGALAKGLLGGMGNGGVLTFDVPNSSGSQFGIDYNVCPKGPDPNGNPPKCVAEVDLANAKLNIATSQPHNITISGPLPLRLQDLPIHIKYFGIINSDIDGVLNGNGVCPGKGAETFADVNINIPISIEIDTNPAHSRHGYSKVVVTVDNNSIDQKQLQDSLHFCGGFDATLLNGLKSIVFGQLIGPLVNTLKDQINNQLCQKSNPMVSPSCPDGSTDDNGTCKYNDGSCVSIMLGTDGHIDLGGLLATLSPGTKGGLDFLFAAGGEDGNPTYGNLNPVANGATLGLYGGALPKPPSTCVKLANMDVPKGIPIPDELMKNTIDNWPAGMDGPHVGIGLNERFFNYALSGMYDSGLLCIGIDAGSLSLGPISLNSDLFGTFLGAASLKNLGLQNETQDLALVVRPSSPPSAVFGNGTDIDKDPLIDIKMKGLSIDFYIWSLDRYIRFMTYTVDVEVPVNLTVSKDGLTPVLKTIKLTNPTATNASLLSEDPASVAKKLTDLVGSQLGNALGGVFKPIDLNKQLASLGITLNIPDSVDGQGSPGLRKLTKDSDNYLGIFATFGLANMPPPEPNETKAQLVHKQVDPAGLVLATVTSDNAPIARVAFSSPQDDGSRAIEYQVRVDGGFWKPWTRRRELDIQEGSFRLQGKHIVEVRSRVVGQPLTEDSTPAVVEVVIDALPPVIRVKEHSEGMAEIVVKDSVSKLQAVLVRYRLDGGAWSSWLPASEMPLVDISKAGEMDVEAKDEEGLVGTATQAIRGKPLPSMGSGCGCTVAGDDSGDGKIAGLLGALLVGAVLRFGRRRNKGQSDIAGSGEVAASDADEVVKAPAPAKARARRNLRVLTAVAAVVAAGSIAGCNCGNTVTASTSGDTGGGTGSGGSSGADKLNPGLPGEYLSAVVSGDTLIVAGYVEKSLSDQGDPYPWGDLAVGKYNGTSVDWVLVDGVPKSDPDPKFDPSGWRGGITDPGDDVGLWTSLAADDKGNLGVAYYDRTHKALKFAVQKGGSDWTVTTVQQKPSSDLGKYAKLMWLNGAWNVAFLAIEPGDGGAVTSGVRLATSADGAAWTFEDVIQDKATPCTAKLCASNTACIKATGLCTPQLGMDACNPACSSSQACVDAGGGMGACQDKHTPAETETYPNATGDYIAIAKEKGGTLGMVFYDRVVGNLMMATKASGSWVTSVLDGNSNGKGDVGIGATLAIDDAGVWHVAYSNGYDESLQYLEVKEGKPGTPEVIDDGAGVEGTPFDDGRHIVGDDANIHVSAGGDIQVSYQDATAGTLHYAVGTASASGHSWAVKVIKQDGFAGAFSRIVDQGGSLKVLNWWRKGGDKLIGDVAVVTP